MVGSFQNCICTRGKSERSDGTSAPAQVSRSNFNCTWENSEEEKWMCPGAVETITAPHVQLNLFLTTGSEKVDEKFGGLA